MNATLFISSIIFSYFSCRTISDKLTSSICAILICATSFFSPLDALLCFMMYIFLDLFFRKTELSVEMKVHHYSAFILSLFGALVICLYDDQRDISLKIALYFILMEITSPILNLVKYFRETNQPLLTIFCSVLLLVMWIVFRLMLPFEALVLLSTLFLSNVFIFPLFASAILLFYLQIYWFLLLCVLFFNLFSKKKSKNDCD